MQFHAPHYLWLLLLVPLLSLPQLWQIRRRRALLKGMQEHYGLTRLVRNRQKQRRLLPLICHLLALASLILALAQPSWDQQPTTQFTRGRQLYIAIDISRSMWATDVGPSRLDQAKILARDLIKAHPNEQISLISFAGSASIQSPPTLDHNALLQQIHHLSPQNTPLQGTRFDQLLELVQVDQSQSSRSDAILVIFSDGEDHSPQDPSSSPHSKLTIPILAVGIGTDQGSPIPDPQQPSQYLRDLQGQLIHTRLNSQQLSQLSQQHQGLYLSPINHNQLSQVVDQSLAPYPALERLQVTGTEPIKRHPLLLTIALILILIGESSRSNWLQPSGQKPTAPPKKPHTPAPKNTPKNPILPLLILALLILPRPLHAQNYQQLSQQLLSQNPTQQHQAHQQLGQQLYAEGLQAAQNQQLDQARQYWQDALSHLHSAHQINPSTYTHQSQHQIQQALLQLQQQQNQQANQQNSPEPADNKDQPVNTDPTQTDNSDQTNQTENPTQTDNSDQTNQTENPTQADTPDTPDTADTPDQPDPNNQPNTPDPSSPSSPSSQTSPPNSAPSNKRPNPTQSRSLQSAQTIGALQQLLRAYADEAPPSPQNRPRQPSNNQPSW